MIEIVEQRTIDAPVAAVWAVLADFESISRWAPNVDHSCLTTDVATGIGAVRRIQSGRTTVLERVIAWEAEQQLTYAITGLPPVIRSVTNTWSFVDLGASTQVTLTSAIDAGPRPPQQVVARIVGRVLATASRQMLDGLTSQARSEPQRGHHHDGASA